MFFLFFMVYEGDGIKYGSNIISVRYLEEIRKNVLEFLMSELLEDVSFIVKLS